MQYGSFFIILLSSNYFLDHLL